MARDKILTLEALAERIAAARAQGKTVALCHGCFDLLHIGHLRHFEAARRQADLLVVTLTPDALVNKGPGRPAFPEALRLEALAALDLVDYVALNHWPTAVETLALLKPDFYVKGREYEQEADDVTGGIARERAAIEAVGGQVIFTDEMVFSSSKLLNRFLPGYPAPVVAYLEGFRARAQFADLKRWLDGAGRLRVLTVGETIIDEYQYCEAIGKSSKEPTLAVRDLRSEQFAGGILAVANHVSDFAAETAVLSQLGAEAPQQAFIEAHLDPRVRREFLLRAESPTIVKKRIIEHYFFTKMLEVYTINDAALSPADNRAFCERLEALAPQFDVVIVVDFGHSLMTPEAISILNRHARFLAVNAQTNAGNQGFNLISKYPRADFMSLAEKELRLEARDHRGPLEPLLQRLADRLGCERAVVTQGNRGSLCYQRGGATLRVPALAREVVDRVGAGDAFLAIAALCAAQEAPLEQLGFIGNAVGAFAVSTVCNREPVRKVALLKQLAALLK